jgi:hypothetical protein
VSGPAAAEEAEATPEREGEVGAETEKGAGTGARSLAVAMARAGLALAPAAFAGTGSALALEEAAVGAEVGAVLTGASLLFASEAIVGAMAPVRRGLRLFVAGASMAADLSLASSSGRP